MLLNSPSKVERLDGKKVDFIIKDGPWKEIGATTKLFFSKRFLLIVLFIGQAVFAEAVFFTCLSLWFSVRARALGSFLSGIVAIISGNLLGHWLDYTTISLKTRARSAFITIITLQGAWWIWATVLVTRFRVSRPTYDWETPSFGAAFAVFLFLTIGFQLNYLFLYFIIHNLSKDDAEVVRYTALLRGTESAWQALSYGLGSLTTFAEVGSIYINFGLWGISIFPVWLVLRHFGASLWCLQGRCAGGGGRGCWDPEPEGVGRQC